MDKLNKLIAENKFEEVLDIFKELIKKQPIPHHYFNAGIILSDLRRFPEAVVMLKQARDLKPNCPVIRFYLVYAYNKIGEYRKAAIEQEWRFTFPEQDSYCPNPLCFYSHPRLRQCYPKPDWDGSSPGKIVVFNESGFGDAILYWRFLPRLNNYVILEVKEELARLALCIKGVNEIMVQNLEDKLAAWTNKFTNLAPTYIDLPEHDYTLSVNSLVYWLDPDLQNVLVDPYIFLPNDENEAVRIIRKCKKLKVGIVWAGNENNNNDYFRSCHLRNFSPLVNDNIQLFSLQKGKMKRSWQVADYSDQFVTVDLMSGNNINFIDLSPYLTDFYDTALAIRELDLVVSVDTSIAHLAGAIGKKVYLLLSEKNIECRWQKVWYSSMKIFQQEKLNDWKGLVEKVNEYVNRVNVKTVFNK